MLAYELPNCCIIEVIGAECRPPVERVHSWLQRLPLVGSLSNKATEILFGIQDHYTYTSGS